MDRLNSCPACGHEIEKWRAAQVLACLGGASKTDKKVKASRINGKKGGRPKTSNSVAGKFPNAT